MNGNAARFLRLGVSLSGLLALGWVLTGQAAKPAPEGLPTDWTHHHVVFSKPSTYEQVRQVTSDPRYWHQWFRQNVTPVLADPETSGEALSVHINTKPGSAGAWAEDMGQSALGVAASVGAGNYPAKYRFQTASASCTDYVVFNTGLLGSTTQASVVAYDNLYSGGCTPPVPQTYWAYNTGGTVLTSPTISADGEQVAFVQTAGGEGTLVLLKWASASGTVSAPVTLTAVANSAYRACTAPCMTTIILVDHLGVFMDDTTSSVFPDYTHDIIWVGGASGWLHQITGVFRGTPKEVTTGGFPVQVNPGNPTPLSSPVYDTVSGKVFVGDYGGIFYSVTTANPPVVTASAEVDFGAGLTVGPIVDSTSENVYVFSSSDGTTAWSSPGSSLVLAVAGAALLVGGNGVIYSVDAQTGAQGWSYSVGGTVTHILASGSVAYVASDDGYVRAINTADGSVKWAYNADRFVKSGIAAANGVVYFGCEDRRVYAVDAAGGHLKWSYLTGGAIDSGVALNQDRVFAGSVDGNLYALQA